MTPVAPLVAIRATTWEAALEETLSGSARTGASHDLSVHSVHGSVVNIRTRTGLIALADDRLDDAPWTIRIPSAEWTAPGRARIDDRVLADARGLELRTAAGAVRILLDPADRWVCPAPAGTPSAAALRDARAALTAFPAPAPMTAFGRASARLLEHGVRWMRADATALIRGVGSADAVAQAARELIGLGEGLTPSGDDILTGLGFLVAHRGFGLGSLLEPLSAAVRGADSATTLLSLVTLRAALAGRARRRLHELIAAVIAGDRARVVAHAAQTAAIGHTSGHDILTGIRLGLGLAEIAHSADSPIDRREGETR